MLTLKCNICGRIFEAKRRRAAAHCKECAKLIRKEGRGPIQQKRRGEDISVIQTLDWSKAEKYLFYYLKRFGRFPKYDGANPDEINEITEEDRKLANQVAARMSKEVWGPLIHNRESITEIGQWDLLHMSDQDWQVNRNVVHRKLAKLVAYPGIGVARLTKALHRKRPRLIPICDSVLCKAFTIAQGNKADRIIQCMDGLRQVGRESSNALGKLRKLTKSNGTELTELRILEVLYWVEFGPFRPDVNELADYLKCC